MIRWKRSTGDFVESHCGKWRITPLYCGCTRPQSYELWYGDGQHSRGWYQTQREAKEDAERLKEKLDSAVGKA